MMENTCRVDQTVVNKGLILIPDISGFTQYMSASSLAHSQANIARLLSSIIDSNKLDLSISEIEGDAILFYKFNENSSFEKLSNQIELMYISFHKTLNEINQLNNCKCGACNLLYDLKIKFIVHYGEIGSVRVNDACKLFGIDIIIAHRLLKNDLLIKEYALFTESSLKHYSANSVNNHSDWANPVKAQMFYDHIGEYNFYYTELNFLKESFTY